ncbi:MAG: hypothetical protein AAF657_22650 [Acidobacteriota bacterium]
MRYPEPLERDSRRPTLRSLIIPFALALLTALLSTPAAEATEIEPPKDCDEAFQWASQIGSPHVTDNCDYRLGNALGLLTTGGVTQEFGPHCPGGPLRPPHRLMFRFWIQTHELSMAEGESFRIFELRNDAPPHGPESLLEISLVETGIIASKRNLIIDWQSDDASGQATPLELVDPNGAILEVWWSRSFNGPATSEIDPNGTLRVYLDDFLVAEATALMLEEHLPTAASFGVFGGIEAGTQGIFTFKPLDHLWGYHRNTGPSSGAQ